MKLGRNDKCWCGSGKKYKKCHLGRESAEKMPISDGVSAVKRAQSSRGCNAPPQMRKDCSGGTISSHTISKSLGLNEISEKGHVLGLNYDLSTLQRTKGKAELGKIGINKMSVFPGFCAHHDTTLFACIEQESFQATPQQCAMLSYRALARERHTKAGGIDVNEFLKGADKGRPFPQQLAIQMMLSDYGLGLSLAADDLDKAQIPHHEAIESGDFSHFESMVLKFPSGFPLLCSTGHMPHDDWNGKIIQDLSDPKLKADWLTAVSFRSSGHSWVVFTWLRKKSIIKKYVESLERFTDQEADALIKYFFTISENIAVNPSWWSGLDTHIKSALESRIMDGVPIGGGPNVIAPRKGEPIIYGLNMIERFFV